MQNVAVVAPNLRLIAERAGVSKATVSYALRNHPKVSAARCAEIHKLAAEMGYRPNPLVATLMAHLKTGDQKGRTATLGFIGSNPESWTSVGDREFLQAAESRANQLGFGLDRFWLNSPGLKIQRLNGILRSRGICGLVIALDPGDQSDLSLDWSRFAVATRGYQLVDPVVNRACNHHSHLMARGLKELEARGYSRIGLVISSYNDERQEHNWLAGYLVHQQKLPAARRVPPLVYDEWNEENVVAWLKRQEPDVVLSDRAKFPQFLRRAGYSVPRDIGFAQIDLSAEADRCAGLRHKSAVVGTAVVDLVVAQLHRNERGVPEHPKVMLVEGEWVDGPTVRAPKPAAVLSAENAPAR